MCRLGIRPWEIDPGPPELDAWLASWPGPPGRALDLGCGTGRQSLRLAQHGWQVVGVDFVPLAVAKAYRRVAGAQFGAEFVIGDVTRLGDLDLGDRFQLVLDCKCFHGLPPSLHARYAAGVASACAPGGSYLLFALTPNRFRERLGAPRGVSRAEVERLFAGDFDDLTATAGSGGLFTPSCYRMRRALPAG
jgi:SAM-dependent methyltransferase